MIAAGRCAGCGHEDASARKVRYHTSSCAKFIELWRASPEKALDPEAEHARVHGEEHIAAKKDAKLERHYDIKERLQGLAAERQLRDQQRWQSVVTHEARQVVPPPDGVLAHSGPTQAHRDMVRALTTTTNGLGE